MHHITLSTSAPDTDALWSQYRSLTDAAATAVKTNAFAYSLLKQATDPKIRARHRARVSMLTQDHLVLSGYASAFRAAWLFGTYGTDSFYLEALRDGDEPVTCELLAGVG